MDYYVVARQHHWCPVSVIAKSLTSTACLLCLDIQHAHPVTQKLSDAVQPFIVSSCCFILLHCCTAVLLQVDRLSVRKVHSLIHKKAVVSALCYMLATKGVNMDIV